MIARLGCKPSHPDKLATKLPLREHPIVKARLKLHNSGASPLPKTFDLDSFSPPRVDQGASGSCTWGSTSCAIPTAFAAAGEPLGYTLSQRVGYGATRAYERALGLAPGQTVLPDLADTGAELADVMTVLARYGVKPMLVNVTPDGRNYDLWTDDDVGKPGGGNVNEEVDLLDLEQSGQKLITGPYLLNPKTQNASDLIATALVSGIPCETAFFCDSAFQALNPNQVANAPVTSDPQGGGHAVFLSGFETLTDGNRVFYLTNSWSGSWCDGGRCLVGPQWLDAAWEVWPMDVAKKAA